jgi:hypothetical protein
MTRRATFHDREVARWVVVIESIACDAHYAIGAVGIQDCDQRRTELYHCGHRAHIPRLEGKRARELAFAPGAIAPSTVH